MLWNSWRHKLRFVCLYKLCLRHVKSATVCRHPVGIVSLFCHLFYCLSAKQTSSRSGVDGSWKRTRLLWQSKTSGRGNHVPWMSNYWVFITTPKSSCSLGKPKKIDPDFYHCVTNDDWGAVECLNLVNKVMLVIWLCRFSTMPSNHCFKLVNESSRNYHLNALTHAPPPPPPPIILRLLYIVHFNPTAARPLPVEGVQWS